MQRTREFTEQRVYGMGFICIVSVIFLCIHFTFVLCLWWPMVGTFQSTNAMAFLVVNNILFANLCFTFYKCIMTDPGLVPANWGFYMGDETKRRRYCKMCNVWKPDRTHHCSICNRCILNMDHHCPWINNCVGFYNRKFFIQLLCYVYVYLIAVVGTATPGVYGRGFDIWEVMVRHEPESEAFRHTWYWVKSLLILIAFATSALLVCTLTNFTRFHVKLVMDNFTTIENLEREEGAKSKFDIGRRRNLEQVFGANAWLWWLPMHTQASRPVGDGVRWRVHYTRVIDEDEELPAE